MEEWQEAFDMLMQCMSELENAMHLGDVKRIRECRQWVNESSSHEKQAFREAIAAMGK